MTITLFEGMTEEEYIAVVGEKTKELLEWALTLRIGDMINDCSMFNVDITEIEFEELEHENGGTYVYDCSFNGCCSLIHCGIEPKKPRVQIEKEYLSFINYTIENKSGFFDLDLFRSRRDLLLSGEHITDENGKLKDRL